MIIGYARVSTVEQNDARQMVTMEKYNVEKVFSEKVSAKDTNRPQFQEMIKFIDNFYEFNRHLNNKQDLSLVIHDFSRLARSTKDLLEIVDYLEEKNVTLISAKENIDTSTATGRLMLKMISAINDFERENMLERQREGIAIAKSQGKYKGRNKIDFPSNWDEIYPKWKVRELTATKAMELLELKRNTFYKLVQEYEGKNK